MCGSVWQCVAVCGSVCVNFLCACAFSKRVLLQRVAAFCSVSQRVAVCEGEVAVFF